MSDKAKLELLAQRIAERIQERRVERPKLRLVARDDLTSEPKGLDAQSRDVIYARIRDLSRMFWLQWLVRQETAKVNNVIECLDDSELLALLEKMERARECREDGDLNFVEAGLVREVTWEIGA